MIIGISGKKTTGKDTVGEICQKSIFLSTNQSTDNMWMNNNTQFEIKKFADKLKDIVCLLIGCTRMDLEDENFKNTKLGEEWMIWKITADNGVKYVSSEDDIINLPKKNIYKIEKFLPTPRFMLQYIGTDLFRNQLHVQTWVNATMADYKPINSMHSYGNDEGMLIYPKWIITDVRFPNEAQAIKKRKGLLIRINRDVLNSDNHDSEIALDDYNGFDYVVDNNGSMYGLVKKINKILIKENLI